LKSATPFFSEARQRWLLVLLTLFTFFFLLGSRALNEPDEGRYAEIAREMIETGDWIVPHFWYLPHLDKPPMTYWLVAISMKLFGQNEWAVRLPLALAGISGVWAAWLFGCLLAGRRVGFWSVLILQSSLLYFALSRMLTTDIFLTQFVAWAMYFLWRSWAVAQAGNETRRVKHFFAWHLAAWVAIALGFLTKGPIALAIPLVALAALFIYRRKQCAHKLLWWGGLIAGLGVFLVLVLPWFLTVFRREPDAFDYMLFGQAAGHLLGTTIKNRKGSPVYFIGILAFGLLPWTVLLGWLWRRAHWRSLPRWQKEAWLLLNVWAIFTFVLFSLSEAKLPPYILPIFPALAVMLAWRFFNNEQAITSVPEWAWRICLACGLLLPAVFPWLLVLAFHDSLPTWMKWQTPVIVAIVLWILWLARKWRPTPCAALTIGLAVCGFMVTVAEIPLFQTTLRRNQTLQLLGLALRTEYHAGDIIVCWGRLPEGLPFYAYPAINATNRPYFGDMDFKHVPFEYPGNQERMGSLLLTNETALAELLQKGKPVFIVTPGNSLEKFRKKHETLPLHTVMQVGQWKLFSNR
jgi:4-amino-4-deoxy-L-arabinose transferase-like glycosyltransferase